MNLLHHPYNIPTRCKADSEQWKYKRRVVVSSLTKSHRPRSNELPLLDNSDSIRAGRRPLLF